LKLWEDGYAVVYTLRRTTKELSLFQEGERPPPSTN